MKTRTNLTLITASLLVLLAPQLASSATCNENSFHCITDNVYQLCLDGSSTTNTEALVCPATTRCSSDCKEPCLPESSTPCIKCYTNTTFLCHDETSFQMCLDESNVPFPEIFPCSNGTICSSNCQSECVSKNDLCKYLVTCTTADVNKKLAHPTSNKIFYLCTQTEANGPIIPIEYTCPGTSTFDKAGQKCKVESTTTTTRAPFVCPGSGKYPDPSGITGYYQCTMTDEGLTPTYMACPTGTVYNTVRQTCTKFTTSTITTPPEASTTPMPFVCSTSGKFPDPQSCNRYILCTSPDEVTFTATTYTCPNPSFYNDETERCTSTRPSSCPVLSRSLRRFTPEFECTDIGRFADPDSCNHYYLCLVNEEDEEYESYYFPCPDASRYNPETKQCTNFDIPCGK